MLEEITIENLGGIERTTVRPSQRLTVLTGETGAGKSMILGALHMLLGGRSNQGLVRNGADSTKVEGCWNLQQNNASQKITEIVQDAGGEIEDQKLHIARRVSSAGKSKAVLGGTTVPASKLTETGKNLVHIHGQSEQIKLKSPTVQLATLDRFVRKLEQQTHTTTSSTFTELLQELSNCYAIWQQAKATLLSAQENSMSRNQQMAFLENFINDFDSVQPEVGEMAALKAQADLVANAEEIHTHTSIALQALAPEHGEGMTVAQVIDEVSAHLMRVSQLAESEEVRTMQSTTDRIAENIAELATFLQSYIDNTDVDAMEDLYANSTRYLEIQQLLKKYGNTYAESTVGEDTSLGEEDRAVSILQQEYDNATRELERLSALSRPLSELEEEMALAYENFAKVAQSVAERRRIAAERLSEQVNAELQALAMGEMRFSVSVAESSTVTRNGTDAVSFDVQAPGAKTANPIAKTASGGELSRIMLALEVVIASPEETATFVFDEVDSGVGGATAIEIGKRLAKLAQKAQVIVVTHLPQIACLGDTHLKVSKTATEDTVQTTVAELDTEQQQTEITRMLSGMTASKSGKEHAKELLQFAETFKKSVA